MDFVEFDDFVKFSAEDDLNFDTLGEVNNNFIQSNNLEVNFPKRDISCIFLSPKNTLEDKSLLIKKKSRILQMEMDREVLLTIMFPEKSKFSQTINEYRENQTKEFERIEKKKTEQSFHESIREEDKNLVIPESNGTFEKEKWTGEGICCEISRFYVSKFKYENTNSDKMEDGDSKDIEIVTSLIKDLDSNVMQFKHSLVDGILGLEIFFKIKNSSIINQVFGDDQEIKKWKEFGDKIVFALEFRLTVQDKQSKKMYFCDVVINFQVQQEDKECILVRKLIFDSADGEDFTYTIQHEDNSGTFPHFEKLNCHYFTKVMEKVEDENMLDEEEEGEDENEGEITDLKSSNNEPDLMIDEDEKKSIMDGFFEEYMIKHVSVIIEPVPFRVSEEDNVILLNPKTDKFVKIAVLFHKEIEFKDLKFVPNSKEFLEEFSFAEFPKTLFFYLRKVSFSEMTNPDLWKFLQPELLPEVIVHVKDCFVNESRLFFSIVFNYNFFKFESYKFKFAKFEFALNLGKQETAIHLIFKIQKSEKVIMKNILSHKEKKEKEKIEEVPKKQKKEKKKSGVISDAVQFDMLIEDSQISQFVKLKDSSRKKIETLLFPVIEKVKQI